MSDLCSGVFILVILVSWAYSAQFSALKHGSGGCTNCSRISWPGVPYVQYTWYWSRPSHTFCSYSTLWSWSQSWSTCCCCQGTKKRETLSIIITSCSSFFFAINKWIFFFIICHSVYAGWSFFIIHPVYLFLIWFIEFLCALIVLLHVLH